MTEARWRRHPSTLFRRTTTGVVLLPSGAAEPVELAGSAALIWDLLEEPTTEEEAIEVLARACGEDGARIGPEITALLGQLEDIGAAEPAPC